MSLPQYPRYKESGVKWMGEVPEHWHLQRLFTVCKFESGMAHEPYIDDEGQFICVNSRFVSTDGESRKFCTKNLSPTKKNDILMVMSDLPNGRALAKAFFVKEDGPYAVNQRVCILSPQMGDPKFLYYYLNRNPELLSHDDGMNQTHLWNDLFTKLPTLIPSLQEQTVIASFLDHEIAKIDALVAEQRRLIELLKEKRQAVISHAVTKGLNPGAPMKDSGIAWLGKVPSHWNVCLLKRTFRSVDYGISDSLNSEGTIAILRMGNIENGKVVTDDLKYANDVDSSLLLVRGDLLYNRTNSLDLIGKVGMFMGDGKLPVSFASYLVRLRTVDESTPEYFAYLLNTEGILGLARSNAFVAIGQCNLNPTRYGEITVAIPPLSEQTAIVERLNAGTAKLDALTAEATRAIDLLQERRTALISAAVTGKIDVRGMAKEQTA